MSENNKVQSWWVSEEEIIVPVPGSEFGVQADKRIDHQGRECVLPNTLTYKGKNIASYIDTSYTGSREIYIEAFKWVSLLKCDEPMSNFVAALELLRDLQERMEEYDRTSGYMEWLGEDSLSGFVPDAIIKNGIRYSRKTDGDDFGSEVINRKPKLISDRIYGNPKMLKLVRNAMSAEDTFSKM
jgi:hypothetical protein